MSENKESLIRSDKRIVAVSKWRNKPTVHHLKGIYNRNRAGFDRGYRSFFNELANTMTVSQAADCLNWKMSSDYYLTLQIYPSSDFYFGISRSREEREFIFRAAVRRAVIELKKATNLPLNWVGAVNASCCFMVGTVVISKVVFDGEERQFRVIKNPFPHSFFVRDDPKAENTNYFERTIAKSFFECAAQTENFESQIDDLIKISRKYKFDLPGSHYAFRHLDEVGNLITEPEGTLENYE